MERQALQRAREAFLSGRTRAVEFRLQQLHALQKMISEKETDISSALKQDINRVRGGVGAPRGVPQGTRPGPVRLSLPDRIKQWWLY